MRELPRGIARSILDNLDSFISREIGQGIDENTARTHAISTIKMEYAKYMA